MSTELVIGLLGVGGLSAIIASIVTGLFSKRKLGAEATELITRAAGSVVKSLEDQLRRQEEQREADRREHAQEIAEVARKREEDRAERAREIAEFERKLEEVREVHSIEIEDWRQTLQLHVAWDHLAMHRLAERGVILPDAPPLTPPRRRMAKVD
jgi:uncharacterized protein YlxW (UPF0749 family)